MPVSKPAAPKTPAKPELKAAESKSPERTPEKPSPVFAASGFYLQLGSFSSETNARQVLAQAKSAGYSASVVTSGGQSKVRVGPYSERDKALEIQAKLKAKGLASVLVGP